MDTRKQNPPYFPSKETIISQFSELFKRKYRYVITSSEIIQSVKKKRKRSFFKKKKTRSLFLYQESIIVNLHDSVFNKEQLLMILRKGLEDMINILELNSNLLTFEFLAACLYYLITKNTDGSEYYIFLGHTNTDNPYIPDNVKWIKGINNLEFFIDEVLATNHFEQAKQQFADQFPDSDVVVDSVTHIVFIFQPFNYHKGIQRELYWTGNCMDNLCNII